MELLEQISEHLQKGKAKEVRELVQQAVDEGIPSQIILEEGLLSGMGIISEKFKRNEQTASRAEAGCASARSRATCTTSARTWSK